MKVSVLGTGIMGSGICKVLAAAGFDVTAWNRTHSKAAALETSELPQLRAESDLSQAVADADVIMVVAFDADSVIDVMGRCVDAAPHSAMWMQMATIGAEGAHRVRDFACNHDISAVETMMMGSRDQAASSRLILIGGGKPELFKALEPLTSAIAQKTVIAGDTIGDGTAVKLACNAWIAGITVTAAQSVQLLKHEGVNPQLFLDVIEGGTSDSPYAHMKGGKAISGDYSSQFEISALAKDMNLMREVMKTTGMRCDFLDTLIGLYSQASEAGHAHDDISAVAETFA
jgi:3-hydroxyisobutyrate dehydrogenase